MTTPHIVTVSGPSLSGKTEFTKLLKEQCGFNVVVSITTRPQRGQEKDGIDYHFITLDEYKKTPMVQTTFFNGNYYGVSEQEVLSKKDKPLLWVIAPQSIPQVEQYCLKKGWNLTKVFISNPEDVILSRLFMRFKNDSLADPSVYIKRLRAMQNEEFKWIQDAKQNNIYDLKVDEFDTHNTQKVLEQAIALISNSHKKKSKIRP